jgi:hypothetical protein
MEHWFVYYKLPAAEVAAVAARVRAMMGDLQAATGVRGRLQQRSDRRDGQETLMEIYEGVAEPAEFGVALAAAVHSHLPPTLALARHVERFEDA